MRPRPGPSPCARLVRVEELLRSERAHAECGSREAAELEQRPAP